ncbi:hypothetical protein [Confluentibacter flavum]|uniref:Uncharacterized protein n=1 Tax=Confluentibacter flavum TaxID=1909700 RepID=A0A2N3HEV1_9FLAO|nr:hypothetical protein [Confluentibacter flavum]PKQ43507.1 hypothetical protein CSW08_17690 [Confluentibacter flavum]
MKTKFLSLLVVFFLVANAFSQSNLNNYKYIIIPEKYEFLKENDQFQLNSLTEFLFNKYGFQAFMEGENYPDDLNANRCLALTTDVIKDSSMFKTKLQIELKNCNGLTVYTTKVGESREKDFNKAYAEALRNAFKELETKNYKYVPINNGSEVIVKETKNQTEVVKEIAKLKAEIENLKQDKETQVVITEEPKESVPMVEVPKEDILKVISASENVSGVLYAQAIENGFQLVDSSPKVVYKIKNTSLENVFMVEGKNATLYKKENNWIMEYYENNVLKQEVLNIKF